MGLEILLVMLVLFTVTTLIVRCAQAGRILARVLVSYAILGFLLVWQLFDRRLQFEGAAGAFRLLGHPDLVANRRPAATTRERTENVNRNCFSGGGVMFEGLSHMAVIWIFRSLGSHGGSVSHQHHGQALSQSGSPRGVDRLWHGRNARR